MRNDRAIEIDLKSNKLITRIVLDQGFNHGTAKFTVSYSIDGQIWIEYEEYKKKAVRFIYRICFYLQRFEVVLKATHYHRHRLLLRDFCPYECVFQ